MRRVLPDRRPGPAFQVPDAMTLHAPTPPLSRAV